MQNPDRRYSYLNPDDVYADPDTYLGRTGEVSPDGKGIAGEIIIPLHAKPRPKDTKRARSPENVSAESLRYERVKTIEGKLASLGKVYQLQIRPDQARFAVADTKDAIHFVPHLQILPQEHSDFPTAQPSPDKGMGGLRRRILAASLAAAALVLNVVGDVTRSISGKP